MNLLPPRYTWLPLLSIPALNVIVYNGTRLITQTLPHHSLPLPLDSAIPFVPAFIVFYLLAYVQWVVSYCLIASEDRAFCFRVVAAENVAKLCCMAFFLLYPTTLERPVADSHDLWSLLVRIIYALDMPDNLFPSIHCLESWLCFRAIASSRRLPRWAGAVSLGLTLLVCASTVLVRQHVFLDVIGGIAVAELGLLLSRLFRLERIYDALTRRVLKGGRS